MLDAHEDPWLGIISSILGEDQVIREIDRRMNHPVGLIQKQNKITRNTGSRYFIEVFHDIF